MHLCLRALSIILSTIAVTFLWFVGGIEDLEEIHTAGFTDLWQEFMKANPEILEDEESKIELLVWRWTEKFLFFPALRERMFNKLLQRALHKWRWERSLKGMS